MKLKEIHRTATFAWSPSPSVPLLATGTVSGALDESFSNDSQLEIWAPDFMDRSEYDMGGEGQNGPKASVTTTSRFNRVAWGYPNSSRSRGIIAAGMENGELGLWDPEKLLETSDASASLILRNTTHQGSVRGLDFNPIQTSLLSSGAVNGEIYIWDLKDPSKPYSPGTRSSKLDEVTSLAWNRQVQHVLASSSSTGYTVVWDLRNKREVVALAYGGASQVGHMGSGGRKGMSDVAWHPDNATRLVTSSEDDNSPVVMVWDLRNARAPEKILTGHERGILSVSWCRQDADLLLSCGKDNRALCWNPQTSEIIGELPIADNWAFQVSWCPRNPELLATAYFDGTIGIHNLQSTNEPADSRVAAPTPQADGSDVFDVPGFARTTQPTLSLNQPPKWLRRPVSSSFGYGGKLVSIENLPAASGRTQSSVVHLRKVVTEVDVVERAKKLREAEVAKNLGEFAKEKAETASKDKWTGAVNDISNWKALTSLFCADSRDELVTLLGFSKEEIAKKVTEAIEKLKANVAAQPSAKDEPLSGGPREPVVSFVEPDHTPEAETADLEATPSEQSASAASDITDVTKPADGESTTTVPSLFDDDIGTPQTQEADFFSTIGTLRSAIPDHVQIPHQNYAQDSSVAATFGSRPSSAASESMKSNIFRIYPTEESDVDRLVTKALVLGDFESAVSLCLSAGRYADAILLAVKGGPELLSNTQKAYFAKRSANLPYLRLFQSIVMEDLLDIVQNADLQDWMEIFVVLCTFAKGDEFAGLAEQLGQRLEFDGSLRRGAEGDEYRKNATLTYLAAGKLEKVVNIWIEEMSEEEQALLQSEDSGSDVAASSPSRYSAHAHALQTFVEKVTVFRSATKYVDVDLQPQAQADAAIEKAYRLAGLYDRYFEYADLLATQGLVDDAVQVLNLVPRDYKGTVEAKFDYETARERLLRAAGKNAPSVSKQLHSSYASSSNLATSPTATHKQSQSYGYPAYGAATQQHTQVAATARSAAAPTPYEPYNPNVSAAPSQTISAYAPIQSSASTQQPYQATAQMQPFQMTQLSSAGPYATAQAAQPLQLPGPPPPITSSQSLGGIAPRPPSSAANPPPPPKKRENGGWNDAPVMSERRTATPQAQQKPAAIISPFPSSMHSPGSVPLSPALHSSHHPLPPPPRPGSVQRGGPPPVHTQAPPPQRGMHAPPPGPSPARTFSPPQPQHVQGPPPPRSSQYIPPPQPQGPPGPGGQFASPQAPSQQRGPPPPGPPGLVPHGHHHGGPGPSPMRGGTPPAWQGQQHHQGPQPSQGQRIAPGQGSFLRAASPLGQHVQTSPSLGMQGLSSGQGQVPSPYAPPPGASRAGGAPPMSGGQQQQQQQHQQLQSPPQPSAGSGGPPPGVMKQSAQKVPDRPKYPPGDRSHIPESSARSYNILFQEVTRLKQIQPGRFSDDAERRLNILFDALNCGTLSDFVLDQLNDLTEAIASRDPQRAMAIHVDLLMRGSQKDDIGSWMFAIKQLIMRL